MLIFVFGFSILKERIFSIPRMGSINCHPALLPHHRGATPQNWTIYDVDKFTCITFHYISKIIDGGDIIEQHRIPLCGKEISTTFERYLGDLGGDLFVKLIFKLFLGRVDRYVPDKDVKESYEKPFDRSFCEISQSYSVDKIDRIIRSSNNNAFFKYGNKCYDIIHEVEIDPGSIYAFDYPVMLAGDIYIKNDDGKIIMLVVKRSLKMKRNWRIRFVYFLKRIYSKIFVK